MPSVLITTDFSAPSRHALDYACLLLKDKEVRLDLVHVFILPITYTADAIVLAAMGTAMNEAEEAVQDEMKYLKAQYPAIKVVGRVVAGSFLDTLRKEVQLAKPEFLILGTAGFTDLYFGNDDPLNTLRRLPVPVLFIPHHAPLKPIEQIVYACNYAGVGKHTPVKKIVDWTLFLKAKLHVLHTDPLPEGQDNQQEQGKLWLEEQLMPLQPAFAWVQDKDLLHGITNFVLARDIDCVLIVPKKYGMWENLFRQSRTKALARLNRIPIIAFPLNNDL